jgi:coproporphyrinogen III oxidase-like Fe-S oxidoreductase
MAAKFLDQFLQENRLPPEVDEAAIRREWYALRPPYDIAGRHLPLPIWARRPFDDSGRQAWQTLRRDLPGIASQRPLCVYVHIPFCAERCSFCDCYSFKLASHRQQHIDRYLELLAAEIRLWSEQGTLAARPVSTVHFGGGTPLVLGAAPFERLVGLCRAHLAAGPATEWALESTVSELSPQTLSHLDALGFTRLHIGVQSLQDEVRAAANRRASAGAVLRTIAAAAEMGWIVSVDLIYGLPGQTLAGLVADIRALIGVGVAGFSLYELQRSARNQRFVRQYGLERRDRRHNYLLSQVSARLLLALGYEKTLFNHFAGAQDTNLYFTFPARGEDCLALGTVADGVFGDYHYRHPEYAAYGRQVDADFPGLEGGLRRRAGENRLQPLTTALMAGSVPPVLLAPPFSQELRRRWCESLLLIDDLGSGTLRLSGSGSWFVGNMLSEMADHLDPAESRAGHEPLDHL